MAPALSLEVRTTTLLESTFPQTQFRDSQHLVMQPKPQGVMATNNLQLQGSKNVQAGRPHNFATLSSTKGTALEEFKYGFPSEGLSTASNRWWGSKNPDRDEGACGEAARTVEEIKHQSNKVVDDSTGSAKGNKEDCESEKEENSVDPQGTELLVSVRKRAVEEGKRALKLGVFRVYGAKKLGRKERTLLLRIFKSSMPKDWIPDSS